MSTWMAFLKKEWIELVRSGKFFILILMASLFGIMNPAIAKLTPWLMNTMSDSLQESGIVVADMTVDAMTSWTQFYKNMPMALIIVGLMLGSTFTLEYQKGTLILALTKGLSRRKVYGAKSLICVGLWTLCFWLSYGITWLYNSYYWDNSTVSSLIPSAALFWLFGVWIFLLIVFFSTVFSEVSGVLAGTGIVLLASYIGGIFPKVQPYLPTKLLESQALLTQSMELSDFSWAMAVTFLLAVAAGITGMILFDKKKI
jgi:ABC-2 type transport system permease protein